MSARSKGLTALAALLLLTTSLRWRMAARMNRKTCNQLVALATLGRGEVEMACQRCSTCGVNWPLGTSGCADCGGPTWYSPSGNPNRANGDKPHPSSRKDAIECGACKWELTGYSKTDLAKEGWAWHEANGRPFIMCPGCEDEYAERRLQRAKEAAA